MFSKFAVSRCCCDNPLTTLPCGRIELGTTPTTIFFQMAPGVLEPNPQTVDPNDPTIIEQLEAGVTLEQRVGVPCGWEFNLGPYTNAFQVPDQAILQVNGTQQFGNRWEAILSWELQSEDFAPDLIPGNLPADLEVRLVTPQAQQTPAYLNPFNYPPGTQDVATITPNGPFV